MGVWGKLRPLVAGESNQRVQGEESGCYHQHMSFAYMGAGGELAHLYVEVGGIAEHCSDAIRLRLHVHLLDFTRFQGFILTNKFARCRLISQCSRERSSRSLEGGARQGRSHGSLVKVGSRETQEKCGEFKVNWEIMKDRKTEVEAIGG